MTPTFRPLASFPQRAVVLLAAVLASGAIAAEPPPPLAGLTYSGDQAALAALDQDISAAGTDPAKLAAVEASLFSLLRRTDATYAGRQAICQRLGLVLAHAAPKSATGAYKPLDTMLLEERDCDLARLALEPAPGPAVDALFVSAAGKTSGTVRIALLNSIGARRTATAIPVLAKLLADPHAATAAAAAHALGAIGTPAAEAALSAASSLPAAIRAGARLHAAAHLPAPEARRVVADLQAETTLPPTLRAAAFRLSLTLDAASATPRIVEVLSGSDWTYKQVALESLASALPEDRVTALVAKLGTWDAPTQAAVLGALARAGSAAAVPAVIAATSHADAEVSGAATAALGFLPGNREVVGVLARIAAGDSAAAKAARQSLTSLGGRDVSAALLAAAERGEPALRVVAIEQLALRHQTEALPFLLQCRAESDPKVRAAAVGALGELAPFSAQRALLDWTIAATDDAEQSRALRALVNVTLRQRDPRDRDTAVHAAIEAAAPELAVRLMPALGRLGGTASAECAARLAIRADAKVAAAAVATLNRWTDATALPALATVVESAADPAARESARNGALQYFERNRESWTPATTTLLSRLITATKVPAPRQQLVALLARANDPAALQLAQGLESDAALAGDVRYAAAAISATLAGSPKVRASAASGTSNIVDGKTSSRWSTPALGEEWVEIDFRQSRPFRRLTLDQTARAAEFPERYAVHVTDDPKSPGPAVATGQGQRNRTVITLPAGTQGRYVILKNTAERKDTPWTICELYVD